MDLGLPTSNPSAKDTNKQKITQSMDHTKPTGSNPSPTPEAQ
jgi:hypothetical protein